LIRSGINGTQRDSDPEIDAGEDWIAQTDEYARAAAVTSPR